MSRSTIDIMSQKMREKQAEQVENSQYITVKIPKKVDEWVRAYSIRYPRKKGISPRDAVYQIFTKEVRGLNHYKLAALWGWCKNVVARFMANISKRVDEFWRYWNEFNIKKAQEELKKVVIKDRVANKKRRLQRHSAKAAIIKGQIAKKHGVEESAKFNIFKEYFVKTLYDVGKNNQWFNYRGKLYTAAFDGNIIFVTNGNKIPEPTAELIALSAFSDYLENDCQISVTAKRLR